MSMTRFLGVAAMVLIFFGAARAQESGVSGRGGQLSSAMNASATDFGGAQSAFAGGIPQEEPTGDVLQLSFSEALRRGLNYNLGALLSEQSVQTARGARMVALSQLLPKVTAGMNEAQNQVNLAAYGFHASPGMKTIVGPFNVFDIRAYMSQTVLDFSALNRYRAAAENVKAAQYSHENARDLVVFVCSNLKTTFPASRRIAPQSWRWRGQ